MGSFFPGRLVRYGVVGLACYGVQVLIVLLADTIGGIHVFLAGIIGFLASAGLNFALSNRFTWRDRYDKQKTLRRGVVFGVTVALAAVINASALWGLTAMIQLWQPVLVFGATMISSGFTFVVNHFFTFRGKGNTNASVDRVLPADV